MNPQLPMSDGLITHTTMRNVMTATPRTIESTATIEEARSLMHELRCQDLPVVDGEELVGIVSDRDLLQCEVLAGEPLWFEPVSNAMSRRVYTTTADASLRDVARVMAAEHYGSAVVLEHGRVIGIFTATDALQHLVCALH